MLRGRHHAAVAQPGGERDRRTRHPARGPAERAAGRLQERAGAGDVGHGARSTLTPAPARKRPVARPAARAEAGPRAPCRAALRDGGPSRRRTRPPSWSIITSSGTSTAAGRGIACRRRVSARAAAGDGTLGPSRITAPASPRRMRRTRSGGGTVPGKPKTIRCPASCAGVSDAADGAGAAAGGAPGRAGDGQRDEPAEQRRRSVLLPALEVERRGVDAEAQARRRGAVGEHVAEVRAAVAAHDLGAHHPVARVVAALHAAAPSPGG